MKYIDAEKLTKAIEDKGLDCSFALKMERLDTLALIDSLQQERPSLPSNLDEAAEKKYPVYWKDYPKDGIARSELAYDTNKQCRDAFIAGAKWMEKEINKELIKAMEKVHEIRDVDYDIHVDTSANGSFNRLNIIQNEK